MKKTYTACFILALGFLFYYGELTGKSNNNCPRGKVNGLANNPSTCANCHIGGIVGTGNQATDTVSNTGTTGINDPSFAEGISAYPTLVSDYVILETKTANAGLKYAVYNLSGQQMATGTLPAYPSISIIDINALSPAQYIVRVDDASHGASFRIVKQ